MKIGIVSDTHSNLYALESVLEHMNEIGVDIKVHLGDCIGYGPKPNETLALTLEHFDYIVMGNHDLAVIDPKESEFFNPQAKKAVDWTRDKLSKDEIEVLSNLRYGHLLGDILFVHGSPQANNPHGYLLRINDAAMAFSDPIADFEVAFVGHTHQPFIWLETGHYQRVVVDQGRGTQEHRCNFDHIDKRIIFNVGSVGQPRDNDPRACYVIYDTDKKEVVFYRVPYAVEKTVGLMQRFGFDQNEYERLIYGR